jgi:hypothetical protein
VATTLAFTLPDVAETFARLIDRKSDLEAFATFHSRATGILMAPR